MRRRGKAMWLGLAFAVALLAAAALPGQANAAELIVDNSDTGAVTMVGTWTVSTLASGYHGANYAHDGNTGQGTKSITYFPAIAEAGEYDVYVNWNSASNRSSKVPIDIAHAGGINTKIVNQRANGGGWNRIGRYTFAAGSSGYIKIRNDGADGFVIADAVRLVKVTEIIVDNSDSTGVAKTGSWTASTSSSGYYGVNYEHDGNAGKGSKSFKYSPAIAEAGEYDLYIRWNSGSNRASNVPVDIRHAGGTSSITINQRANGSVWNLVGRYSFSAGSSGYVQLHNSGTDGYVIADAVRLVKAPPPLVPGPDYSPAGTLIFRSGFEAGSTGVANPACISDITGTDQSVATPNNWVTDLEGYSKFGSFYFQYEGGGCSAINASIVTDPTKSGNKVLQYWMGGLEGTLGKGRVQANMHNNANDLNEIYYKFRFYLHPDLELLKQIPQPMTWLTMAEFWNQPSWTSGTQYPYRVSLNLSKPAGGGSGQKLYFRVTGQRTPVTGSDEGTFDTVWTHWNLDTSIPTGQWLTAEIYYKKGNAQNGRFYFAITPAGGTKKVIFDIVDWTYDPNSTISTGLTHFHPFKWYTAQSTANFVSQRGGALQILWDDIEFWSSMN